VHFQGYLGPSIGRFSIVSSSCSRHCPTTPTLSIAAPRCAVQPVLISEFLARAWRSLRLSVQGKVFCKKPCFLFGKFDGRSSLSTSVCSPDADACWESRKFLLIPFPGLAWMGWAVLFTPSAWRWRVLLMHFALSQLPFRSREDGLHHCV